MLSTSSANPRVYNSLCLSKKQKCRQKQKSQKNHKNYKYKNRPRNKAAFRQEPIETISKTALTNKQLDLMLPSEIKKNSSTDSTTNLINAPNSTLNIVSTEAEKILTTDIPTTTRANLKKTKIKKSNKPGKNYTLTANDMVNSVKEVIRKPTPAFRKSYGAQLLRQSLADEYLALEQQYQQMPNKEKRKYNNMYHKDKIDYRIPEAAASVKSDTHLKIITVSQKPLGYSPRGKIVYVGPLKPEPHRLTGGIRRRKTTIIPYNKGKGRKKFNEKNKVNATETTTNDSTEKARTSIFSYLFG